MKRYKFLLYILSSLLFGFTAGYGVHIYKYFELQSKLHYLVDKF